MDDVVDFCHSMWINTCAFASIYTKMDDSDIEAMVVEAAGIVAASNNKVKISHSMELVGFTTGERQNMTIYQWARRKAQKMSVIEVSKGATVPATLDSSTTASVVSVLTTESTRPPSIKRPPYHLAQGLRQSLSGYK